MKTFFQFLKCVWSSLIDLLCCCTLCHSTTYQNVDQEEYDLENCSPQHIEEDSIPLTTNVISVEDSRTLPKAEILAEQITIPALSITPLVLVAPSDTNIGRDKLQSFPLPEDWVPSNSDEEDP